MGLYAVQLDPAMPLAGPLTIAANPLGPRLRPPHLLRGMACSRVFFVPAVGYYRPGIPVNARWGPLVEVRPCRPCVALGRTVGC
jgi:hypothetical protein